LVAFRCFGLAYPFGASPQAPRETLGPDPLFAGNDALKKGQVPPISQVLTIDKNALSLPGKGVSAYQKLEEPLLIRSLAFNDKEVEAKYLARGFGAVPQMGTQGQSSEKPSSSIFFWGEVPINGVQGDYPPAGVWGKAPALLRLRVLGGPLGQQRGKILGRV